MEAVFKNTQGPWLEATIVVKGQTLIVMDELLTAKNRVLSENAIIDVQLSAEPCDSDSWDSIFRGNTTRSIGLERLSGWEYRAYGKVVSVNPVVVDCGLVSVEDVVLSSDPNLVGEYIAFKLSRLSASLS